jgi:peptidoglycan hydrolase CwlO-like protein
VAQLEAQAAELRAQLAQKNALVKQLMDRLRHLTDAFAMWQSHKRQLVQHAAQYAAAGTGSIA